jgi:predicted tellurium resistance membrane protein TerC
MKKGRNRPETRVADWQVVYAEDRGLTAILPDPVHNSSAQNRENPRNGWISERDASILPGCFSILLAGVSEVFAPLAKDSDRTAADMGEFLTGQGLAALLTLTSLELVLGIDNVIFIAILCGRLPERDRDKARKIGLSLAVVSRIMLVLAIGWVMGLREPLFRLIGREVTGKDLILILGGLFLIFKATKEIHHRVQQSRVDSSVPKKVVSVSAVLAQILLIDVVFSIDSVITAVGMTEDLPRPIPIMIAAILLSVGGMLLFSRAIVLFIERNPTFKVLALAFLMLIGVLLVGDGFGHHIPKGYVYFAMAFSFAVEMLQLWMLREPDRPSGTTQY